ncbi:MAG: nuclear transport factor 2 family protein [Deltaproteobacteria bacterium]|jgi:hypothetical protein|nr:nuclear transport factor 2 family protein [Deltaproteobacteria bacterium]
MRSVVLFAAFLGLAGCAHSKIPLTNIDDTDENRQILTIVDEYHRAMENLDATAVLALVSPSFYEDNGNTNANDDYDLEGLKTNLTAEFQRTKALQLQLRVDAIQVEDNQAYAELYYVVRAHNNYPAGDKWETGTDRTRLQFERVGDRWLITSGL